MTDRSLPASYFEQLYAANPNPWKFDTRWYEARKYALTLAALPEHRYRRALEPGCSIGVLTTQLALRCDQLVATDVVESVLADARERVRATVPEADVQLVSWALGDDWSLGSFDLIVLSEVGYYLDDRALRVALADAVDHLDPGGTVISVHWRHHVDDYPLTGDQVQAIVGATPGLVRLGGYQDDDVSIDVFVDDSTGKSVAARTGLR